MMGLMNCLIARVTHKVCNYVPVAVTVMCQNESLLPFNDKTERFGTNLVAIDPEIMTIILFQRRALPLTSDI
jgi:hypothetical protein